MTKDIITSHAGLSLLREFAVGLGLKANCKALKRGLEHDGIKSYTLYIDATGIEAEEESAKMTYKGYPGYMPMFSRIRLESRRFATG